MPWAYISTKYYFYYRILFISWNVCQSVYLTDWTVGDWMCFCFFVFCFHSRGYFVSIFFFSCQHIHYTWPYVTYIHIRAWHVLNAHTNILCAQNKNNNDTCRLFRSHSSYQTSQFAICDLRLCTKFIFQDTLLFLRLQPLMGLNFPFQEVRQYFRSRMFQDAKELWQYIKLFIL